MYEEFYGLKEKPFNLTPDPRYFFLSENHREAYEHLLYGIREREGFIVITGEVGTGKTTLCRTLLNQIDPNATDTALIFNPLLSEQELLQCILSDFGVKTRARAKKGYLDELNQFLLRQQSLNRHSILIIDEAQALSLPVLEEIRILSNLETEKEKLLQIILIGQNELNDKLTLPRLKQLNQRISIRYALRALKKDEVPRYIQHRLMVAGSSGDIQFTSGAFREVIRFSQGIPRLVNLACDRALLAGFAAQSREIQRSTVAKGLKSLQGQDAVPLARPLMSRLALTFAAIMIFCLGLAAAGFFVDFKWLLFKEDSKGSHAALSDDPSIEKLERIPFYTVQLGVFATRNEVMEVAQRVKATGYPLFVSKVESQDSPAPHRIFIGKFNRKHEAEDVAKTFEKAEGFSDIKVILTTSVVPQSPIP
ncbi:MAG: AAA family ATPase [Deltaproteobacteria bacterium]|nr:AAA family ATPase [Deltaproteobacteria bacterium]